MSTNRELQDTLLAQLKAPFDIKFVKWRIGATNSDKSKAIALPYIDSREVQKRLDDVCGPLGWQNKLEYCGDGFICEIGIDINDKLIWKSNAAGKTKVEPFKGGASDALKRAASTWGVGRYLYYIPTIWAPIVPAGKSYKFADEGALYKMLPDWAIPKPGEMTRWEEIAEQDLSISDIGPDEAEHGNESESDEEISVEDHIIDEPKLDATKLATATEVKEIAVMRTRLQIGNENANAINAWLDEQGYTFGTYRNGEWVDSYIPLTIIPELKKRIEAASMKNMKKTNLAQGGPIENDKPMLIGEEPPSEPLATQPQMKRMFAIYNGLTDEGKKTADAKRAELYGDRSRKTWTMSEIGKYMDELELIAKDEPF